MSYFTAVEPKCTNYTDTIELAIEGRERDLGGFTVRRILPNSNRRMVGPFIFFDHMGPAEFPPGRGIQVRPHPHIGLMTITYLFEGEIIHRDNLGYVQPIQVGAVNLMTAGRGIVHSERAPDNQNSFTRLHGIQSWIALPLELEDCEPAFIHYPAETLPEFEYEGTHVRLIIGHFNNQESPVMTHSPTLYLDCRMPSGSNFILPNSFINERAVYVVSGNVNIDDHNYNKGIMAVVCPTRSVVVRAEIDSHIMIIGGNQIGERHIWWNFVSSSKELIEKAKEDWKERRFDTIPGETEYIPLPETK